MALEHSTLPLAALEATPRRERVRIFITEDEAIIALDLQRQLEGSGYTVVGRAAHGQEALEGIASTRPDLVLMDVVIKGAMDGIAAAQRVRERYAIPVLFLTAYADEATLKRARMAGAYGYLVKPFRLDELRAAIEVALYKRGMERALRQSEERFHGAFDCAAIGMALLDTEGRVLQANRALEELLGYGAGALAGQAFGTLLQEPVERERQQLFGGEIRSLQIERSFLHRTGEPIWAILSLATVLDEDGHPANLIAQLQDVTDRRRAEAQLTHLALHDALTGLINRAYLSDQLAYALAHARRRNAGLALLFADLDGFKRVNDTLGHEAGDELLKEIARRIQAAVRAGDSVARWGGDEIVILAPDVAAEEMAVMVARKIIEVVTQAVVINGHPVFVGTSIGIALYPVHGGSGAALIAGADRAMYRAKKLGGNLHCLADPQEFIVAPQP